jgi:hypothetical protein
MDPVTLIVSAIALGAAAGAKAVVPQAIKDAYAGFKGLLVRKFGSAAKVEDAVKQVEDKPQSESRQSVLKEELEEAKSAIDPELIAKAEELLKQLQEVGLAPAGVSYTATLTGSGAIAQGQGAMAAGQGGVVVGGSNTGNINTGKQNGLTDKLRGLMRLARPNLKDQL